MEDVILELDSGNNMNFEQKKEKIEEVAKFTENYDKSKVVNVNCLVKKKVKVDIESKENNKENSKETSNINIIDQKKEFTLQLKEKEEDDLFNRNEEEAIPIVKKIN